MTILYYIHDPMCSWCWGFTETWQQLQAALPEQIRVIRLLGGLAPDTDAPMPEAMQRQLAETWRRIEKSIPGIAFNFAFWESARPKRSTYPACRAVIAARQQGADYDIAMTGAIQQAYYRDARNPSDEATLIELAAELGLEHNTFAAALRAAQTQRQLQDEIEQARAMRAESFPALVLEHQGSHWPIAVDYTDHQSMLECIQLLLMDEFD